MIGLVRPSLDYVIVLEEIEFPLPDLLAGKITLLGQGIIQPLSLIVVEQNRPIRARYDPNQGYEIFITPELRDEIGQQRFVRYRFDPCNPQSVYFITKEKLQEGAKHQLFRLNFLSESTHSI